MDAVVEVTRSNTKNPKPDYDTPWKRILDAYFEDFMKLCWPERHAEIDWTKGYIVLDQELTKITRQSNVGNKRLDKLIQVTLKNGQETCILLHLEVQRGKESIFQKRMFTYNIRLQTQYTMPIVSLAILIDDDEHWRPSSFKIELWGCSHEIKFPIIKLLDYRSREQELEASYNRFAPVILAQLAAMKKRQTMEDKLISKIALTKHLYRRNWSKQEIIDLYTFIDWVMVLPKSFELEYHRSVECFEEEMKMAYITTAERIGIEKGLVQGMEQGIEQGIEKGIVQGERTLLIHQLKRKFGSLPEGYQHKIDVADREDILRWAENIFNVKSLEDLFFSEPENNVC